MTEAKSSGQTYGSCLDGLRPIIAAAWTGVRILHLWAQLDERGPHACAPHLGGQLLFRIAVSAPAEVLTRYGIVEQQELDSLPASGRRLRPRWQVFRGQKTVRIDACVLDPGIDGSQASDPRAERVWDALAPIIASAHWTPPKVPS